MVNHYARLLDWLRWNTRLDLPCYSRLYGLLVRQRSPRQNLGAGAVSRSTRLTMAANLGSAARFFSRQNGNDLPPALCSCFLLPPPLSFTVSSAELPWGCRCHQD